MVAKSSSSHSGGEEGLTIVVSNRRQTAGRASGSALFTANVRYGEGRTKTTLRRSNCAFEMLMISEQCAEPGATMTPAKRPPRRSPGRQVLKRLDSVTKK
jgi:hypothetical protein